MTQHSIQFKTVKVFISGTFHSFWGHDWLQVNNSIKSTSMDNGTLLCNTVKDRLVIQDIAMVMKRRLLWKVSLKYRKRL